MRDIFHNKVAFEPMFNDVVVVSGARNGVSFRATITGCVLDSGFGDPVDEQNVSGGREILFLCRVKGAQAWPSATPPAVGDCISTADGDTFRIYAVKPMLFDEWTMQARLAK